MKKILKELKRKIENLPMIVLDFNTSLSVVDRTVMQKINKEIEDMNNTVNQLDLKGIYRIFYLSNSRIHILQCTWKIAQDKLHAMP